MEPPITWANLVRLVSDAAKATLQKAQEAGPALLSGTVQSIDLSNTLPTATVSLDSDPTGAVNSGIGILGVQPQIGDKVKVLDMGRRGGRWIVGSVGGVNVQTQTTLIGVSVGTLPADGTPTNRLRGAAPVTTNGSGLFTITLPTPYTTGYSWDWSCQFGVPTQALASSSLSVMAGVLYNPASATVYASQTTIVSWEAEGT